MRRLQVIEAMNLAERRGYTFVMQYSPDKQYQMIFQTTQETLAVADHLDKMDIPCTDGTLL